ncbi:ATP phosphoribosyltransferase regulatory subunit [cyanobiont of Ornithocercus magnificus]|nr:ATP phosphoribosyltransferase regulatory subunit [cyanobiont of Ornithocercus magnificus]
MALQPASGARDLNPQQVERNTRLRERLAEVYRLWGYDEVSPPRVERLDTLEAGGAIASSDIVRLVADEPLGLRPEMTASIARAACTRFAGRSRPLRLWASGTVFGSRVADEGGQRIEETLQSGVELFGVRSIGAEMELLSLLMGAVTALELQPSQQPQLLVGHTKLMNLILAPFQNVVRLSARRMLVQFDRIGLDQLDISDKERRRLLELLDYRGEPMAVLKILSERFGKQAVLEDLHRLFHHLEPLAGECGVTLQLDPTFQPHFDLYTGIVFQLVCRGTSALEVVARGGRYDGLVKRCGASGEDAAGVGFSLALDTIRELISSSPNTASGKSRRRLIAYASSVSLERALERQHHWHLRGEQAILELCPCADHNVAIRRQKDLDCCELDWLGV